MSHRTAGWLLCAPALGVLALAFAWPMLVLLRMSLNITADDGSLQPALSAATYGTLLSDEFTWQMTWDSLVLSAVSATAAVLLAYPMALFLFRSRSRWRGILAVTAVAPLLVSGTARVIGWLVILGDGGLVNAGLRGIGLAPAHLINNWTGVRIGLTESVMPYAVLALLAGFGRLDNRLEEAAATLGARPILAFWWVTAPLTAGAAAAAWLLTFVLSISAFITPHLMGGGRVFVLATEIYDLATKTLDWPAAAALSVYALVLLVLLLSLNGLIAPADRDMRPRLVTLLAIVGYGFLLAPLLLVAVMSLSNDAYLNFPPSGWSGRWYAALFVNAPMLEAARTSAILAAVVTVVALLTGVPAAFAVARRMAPPGVATVLAAPLLLPTLVIGLGLLFVLQPLGLVATWPGLALAHLVVVLPFVTRLMTTAFEGVATEYAEAASTLGAAPLAGFALVTLPLALPGMLAAATLSFLVSFDETVISLFLVGPRLTTLPIALFRYTESRTDPLVAALAVVLIGFSAAAVLAVDRLVGFTRTIGRA